MPYKETLVLTLICETCEKKDKSEQDSLALGEWLVFTGKVKTFKNRREENSIVNVGSYNAYFCSAMCLIEWLALKLGVINKEEIKVE